MASINWAVFMGLEFTTHDDVEFARAPLTHVICQVRFSPVLSLLSQAGVAGFQTAVRRWYPRMEVERNADIKVGPEGFSIDQPAPIWRMLSQDGTWRVGLATEFVSLETPNYVNFDDFLERLSIVLDAVDRTVQPAPSTRVGLRKVNELRLLEGVDDATTWRRFINPTVLGLLQEETLPAALQTQWSETALSDADNQMVIRQGVRAELGLGTYVIDMDMFTERPYEVSGSEDLARLLLHYSDSMTSYFHWTLTDEAKQWLEPKPRTTKHEMRSAP